MSRVETHSRIPGDPEEPHQEPRTVLHAQGDIRCYIGHPLPRYGPTYCPTYGSTPLSAAVVRSATDPLCVDA